MKSLPLLHKRRVDFDECGRQLVDSRVFIKPVTMDRIKRFTVVDPGCRKIFHMI